MNRHHDDPQLSPTSTNDRAPAGWLHRLGVAVAAAGAALVTLSGCGPFGGGNDGPYISDACALTFGGGTYHDTYFRDSTGTNHLYTGASPINGGGGILPLTVATAGGYQVCDYTGAITAAACMALPPTSGGAPMVIGPYCQQFTDSTSSMLDTIGIGKGAVSKACALSYGGGSYHDTYFRDASGTNHLYTGASPVDGSGGTLPPGVGTAGGYQVCDYDGSITDGDCLALPATSGGGTMILGSGPYCQQFTDSTNSVLDSIVVARSRACAPTFGGGAYHDTYFRDASGTNHLYTGASPINGGGGTLPAGVSTAGGYQVCDYSGSITAAACTALPATSGGPTMILGSGPYCQQFTDSTSTVLDSIGIGKQGAGSKACPANFGGGVYHDTYFRDAGGTNYLYSGASPIDGSGGTLPAGVSTAGGYQVCDYSGSISDGACLGLPATSGGAAMILGGFPYCQQFTDASFGMLLSLGIAKSAACASNFAGGAYHDTYFRDASGTNHLYTGASPIDGSGGRLPGAVSMAGGYQVCDYSGVISSAGCASLPATSGGGAMILGSGPYCQQFTDSTFHILDSILVQ